jgi:hypothetical protein
VTTAQYLAIAPRAAQQGVMRFERCFMLRHYSLSFFFSLTTALLTQVCFAIDLTNGDGKKPWDTKTLEPVEIRKLRDANPAFPFIEWGVKREIDSGYNVTAVYGELNGKKRTIGIFVVERPSNKIIITLDVFASPLHPFVDKATSNEAILTFNTDYREIARKQYFFNLKDSKLIRSNDLPPAEWTGICDHDGKTEDCFD